MRRTKWPQVDRDEMRMGLRRLGNTLSEAELDELLMLLDQDGDGEIDLKEFEHMSRMKEELQGQANEVRASAENMATKMATLAEEKDGGGSSGGLVLFEFVDTNRGSLGGERSAAKLTLLPIPSLEVEEVWLGNPITRT